MKATIYTRHLNFETKQYKIGKFDLGDGLSRSTLLLGAIAYSVWLLPILLFFGFPSGMLEVNLALVPPALLTIWGRKENEKQPRRKNLNVAAIFGVFYLAGSKSVTNLQHKIREQSVWVSCRPRIMRKK